MKSILKIFSYIFHPLFVSVYTSIYYFYVNSSIFTTKYSIYFIFQIALLTIILPLLVFYLLIACKILSTDIMLNDVKQRRLPLAIQTIYFYFISYYTLKPIIQYDIRYFFIGALLSSIVALIASLVNKKVSLHMIGISGMTTFIIGLSIKSGAPNLSIICSLIILTSIVASSRLALKAHTPSELIWGTIIGICGQAQLFSIWL